jgi:hypothetical protein
MQTSSDDLIDVTNDVGISGKFIKLERDGKIAVVSEAIRERVKIAKKLAEVEGKLKACNDPAKLAELDTWCRTRKRNFESRLRNIAADLEKRKPALLAKLHDIDQRLVQHEIAVEWTVDQDALITSLVPRLVRKSDTFVAERNEIIDGNLNLSDREICKLLDQHFTRDGELSEYFPKTWNRDHGVGTFTSAYLDPKCGGKVHTLISKRRGLRGYPKD